MEIIDLGNKVILIGDLDKSTYKYLQEINVWKQQMMSEGFKVKPTYRVSELVSIWMKSFIHLFIPVVRRLRT